MARGKALSSQEIKDVLSGETVETETIERVGRKLYVDSRKGNKTAVALMAKFTAKFPKQSREKVDIYSDSELLEFLD